MALSKAIAAKVAAYYTGWVDPEEFAEFADKGLIYRQRHHVQPNRAVGFFVIGRSDSVLPIDLLSDLNYATDLMVVLPLDALNDVLLGELKKIQDARKPAEGEDFFEHLFEIDVVWEAGKDSTSGETRYACAPLGPTFKLADIVGPKATKDALKGWEKHAVTLSQVDSFTRSAKRYKVSD